MVGVVRSKRGQLAIGAGVLAIVVVVLVLLLAGGNGSSKPGTAAGATSSGSTAPSSSKASSGDSSRTGPRYSAASAEDCLKTLFGSDSVSDFPGAQSSISLYRRAALVVDVEGEGQGSQSSTGTLLFFASPAKAAVALPSLTAHDKDMAVNRPNGGNVVFIAGHLAADAQVSVMGCLQ